MAIAGTGLLLQSYSFGSWLAFVTPGNTIKPTLSNGFATLPLTAAPQFDRLGEQGASPPTHFPFELSQVPPRRVRIPAIAQSTLVDPEIEQLGSALFIEPVVSTTIITSAGWFVPPLALARAVAEICHDPMPSTLPKYIGTVACSVT